MALNRPVNMEKYTTTCSKYIFKALLFSWTIGLVYEEETKSHTPATDFCIQSLSPELP